jgi:hypothetical protein
VRQKDAHKAGKQLERFKALEGQPTKEIIHNGRQRLVNETLHLEEGLERSR